MELSDRVRLYVERIADSAYDLEGHSLGAACLEQVNRTERDACRFGERTLAQELALSQRGQRLWRFHPGDGNAVRKLY